MKKKSAYGEFYDASFLEKAVRINKSLREVDVENFDETHIIFDMKDCHMLLFLVEKKLTHAEISGETNRFKKGVRLSDGAQAKMEPVFVIFKIEKSIYPITGNFDDVSNVCYRSCSTV